VPGTAGAVPAAGARPHDIILAAMNAAFRRPAINRRTAASAPQNKRCLKATRSGRGGSGRHAPAWRDERKGDCREAAG